MKKLAAVIAMCLACAGAADGVGGAPDVKITKEKLVGTWERVSSEFPRGYRQIKSITPTHFIWVVYELDAMAPSATAGGTWSLQGDTYTEHVDFATAGHEHLRGKDFHITIKLDGDKLIHRGGKDAVVGAVDEVWKKMK